MPYILGVDIGGTFTDASAISLDDGTVHTAKSRSTPDDLTAGLLSAVGLIADQVGLPVDELLADTVKFAHGTTQTSNVIFTWEGARTGLITTKGFADELLIMRARGRVAGLSLSARRHLRATGKPPQIVPRSRIVEVAERVDHHGDVLVPLVEQEARRAVEALLAGGVEAIAVALLWAPENPEHELLVERIVRDIAPDLHVSLSHRLAPVLGEYERTATTVVNAFVAPTVERYLERLSGQLTERGLQAPLLVLQASGGVAQADQVVPINTIESGPAAGMVAVKALAGASNHPNVIATDVGGTTFKVGLLSDGAWSSSRDTILNQYTLILPMVDLVSIGAGGGSIAWPDGPRLRIGPRSAGAEPGPACYGWGGTEPTVTDADLVLGFLNPDRFLGGRLRLRRDLAEKAVATVADALFGGDVVQAAAGIRRIVDSQMADLIRKATIERGHDPREFVLYAYGGAGPVHAVGYATGVGIDTIVVPASATAYSAYGAAASDVHHSLQRSVPANLLEDEPALENAYRALEDDARQLLLRQKVDPDGVQLARWADMRYERQLHDVQVVLEGGWSAPVGAALTAAFAARYGQLYGTGALLRNAKVQLLRIGVDATGTIAKPPLPSDPIGPEDATPAHVGVRPVFWWERGDWLDTPIYDGEELRPGNTLGGPAVVEQPGTTIVVPPGARASVDGHSSIVITFPTEA